MGLQEQRYEAYKPIALITNPELDVRSVKSTACGEKEPSPALPQGTGKGCK